MGNHRAPAPFSGQAFTTEATVELDPARRTEVESDPPGGDITIQRLFVLETESAVEFSPTFSGDPGIEPTFYVEVDGTVLATGGISGGGTLTIDKSALANNLLDQSTATWGVRGVTEDIVVDVTTEVLNIVGDPAGVQLTDVKAVLPAPNVEVVLTNVGDLETTVDVTVEAGGQSLSSTGVLVSPDQRERLQFGFENLPDGTEAMVSVDGPAVRGGSGLVSTTTLDWGRIDDGSDGGDGTDGGGGTSAPSLDNITITCGVPADGEEFAPGESLDVDVVVTNENDVSVDATVVLSGVGGRKVVPRIQPGDNEAATISGSIPTNASAGTLNIGAEVVDFSTN